LLWVLLAFHALNLTVRRFGILNHNTIHPELIRGSLDYLADLKAIKLIISKTTVAAASDVISA